MTTSRQAFDAERRAQLLRYTQLHAQTRTAILEALTAAQAEIAAQLAKGPSQWQQQHLARLAPQIEASLARFQSRGAGVWRDGVAGAWRAGSDLVEQPLAAAGQLVRGSLPAIDDRTLLSMQTFLVDKIKDVTDQARQRISAQLTLALTSVQSTSQTVAAVNRILGGASRQRAITITRTEMGRAHAAATWLQLRNAAAEVPGMRKQWRRSGKLHSRIEHDAADGQVRDIDEPFDIGVQLMYPRDPTAPAKHTINCGCTILPFKDDWAVANRGKRPFEMNEIAADPRRRDANQRIAEQRARAGLPVDVPGIIGSEVIASVAAAVQQLDDLKAALTPASAPAAPGQPPP